MKTKDIHGSTPSVLVKDFKGIKPVSEKTKTLASIHLYEDEKSKAYVKCNECVTKSSDCPIGKLCKNGICRVEKEVYSASPVYGPVIEDAVQTQAKFTKTKVFYLFAYSLIYLSTC